MRRLQSPTLAQWDCNHHWKATTSRPGNDDLVRVRYLTYRHCNLKLKTEERLAVPSSEDNLIDQLKALLPEGQTVVLWYKGVTELPWTWFNARLALHGYTINASKGCDAARLVACIGEDKGVEKFGLFELRRVERDSLRLNLVTNR